MILVTGAGGQLGRALLEQPGPENFSVVGRTRSQLDITDRAAVDGAFADLRPRFVINAAAYTAVDRAESDEAAAYAVNRDGPANLAAACARTGAALIHVSTDYVFDGSGDRPRREGDPIAPLGVYGASKAAGEAAIRERLDRHVIIRTAWLFGRHGANFVRTVMRLAATRPRLTIVDDQRGCPTYADDLAAAILAVVARGADRTGTYHHAGAPATTWCRWAGEILALRGRPGPELIPITTADYPTPARRPANSVLDCRRFAADYGVAPADWRPGTAAVVAACIQEGR